MAFPAFTYGDQVMPGDTVWSLWYKILSRYQAQPGADPTNDPNLNNSLYDLRRKVLRAVKLANGI